MRNVPVKNSFQNEEILKWLQLELYQAPRTPLPSRLRPAVACRLNLLAAAPFACSFRLGRDAKCLVSVSAEIACVATSLGTLLLLPLLKTLAEEQVELAQIPGGHNQSQSKLSHIIKFCNSAIASHWAGRTSTQSLWTGVAVSPGHCLRSPRRPPCPLLPRTGAGLIGPPSPGPGQHP